MIYILSAFGICLLIFAIRAAAEWLRSTAINEAARSNQCHGRESAEVRRRILRKILESETFTQPHPAVPLTGRAPTIARTQGVEVGDSAGGDDQTIASHSFLTDSGPVCVSESDLRKRLELRANAPKTESVLISAHPTTARPSQQPGVRPHNSLSPGFLLSISPSLERR